MGRKAPGVPAERRDAATGQPSRTRLTGRITAGTRRFGTDPASSVLDTECKTHELNNLCVADASFSPSIGAASPVPTVMANAIRVGRHLA